MELIKAYQKTDIGIIPEDWEIKTFGEISYIKGRIGWQGLKQTEFTENPDEPYLITGMNFKDGEINWDEVYHISFKRYDIAKDIQLKPGDVLMTKDGTIGKLLYVKRIPYPYKASLNSHLLVLRPIRNSYVPKFLYYQLDSMFFKNHIELNKSGTTFYGVSQETVSKYQIPLPPLPEQKSIAEVLTDTDNLIQSLEKQIAKKRLIKRGAMQKLLTPEKEWEEKKLSDTATLKARIGWQGLTTAEYRTSGEYHLITGTDFSDGFIDWKNCFFVEKIRYNQDRNIQIRMNDVLVTKDGTIGKVAFIKSLPKPATLNSGVFVIRPLNNSFHPEFFYYILMSEVFKLFLNQLSAGSTINHLYQKDFVNFKFDAPKAYKDQMRIANVLSEMDSEILVLQKKINKYKLKKIGLMKSLLTGKIRLKKNGFT
jgi:type I restriction enzyme, S subunit